MDIPNIACSKSKKGGRRTLTIVGSEARIRNLTISYESKENGGRSKEEEFSPSLMKTKGMEGDQMKKKNKPYFANFLLKLKLLEIFKCFLSNWYQSCSIRAPMVERKVEVLEWEIGQLKSNCVEKNSDFKKLFSAIHEKINEKFVIMEEIISFTGIINHSRQILRENHLHRHHRRPIPPTAAAHHCRPPPPPPLTASRRQPPPPPVATHRSHHRPLLLAAGRHRRLPTPADDHPGHNNLSLYIALTKTKQKKSSTFANSNKIVGSLRPCFGFSWLNVDGCLRSNRQDAACGIFDRPQRGQGCLLRDIVNGTTGPYCRQLNVLEPTTSPLKARTKKKTIITEALRKLKNGPSAVGSYKDEGSPASSFDEPSLHRHRRNPTAVSRQESGTALDSLRVDRYKRRASSDRRDWRCPLKREHSAAASFRRPLCCSVLPGRGLWI
ncbi:hypothetical protein M5K25_024903 [Dendrobium thyrsiflorum]|uniref:Uncharacterized protein n=1 Tax=Dendrobium thyrsiflorum TaxID=117978 RepID=A0ABD0U7T6_DENTH